MMLLGRQKHAVNRDRRGQRTSDILFGGPHHIEMVGPRIGDHSMRGANELRLREPLKLRLQRHALDDERLGPLGGRHGDRLLLLDYVRATRSVHRHLPAVR